MGTEAVSARDVNPNNVASDLKTTFDLAYSNASDVEGELMVNLNIKQIQGY